MVSAIMSTIHPHIHPAINLDIVSAIHPAIVSIMHPAIVSTIHPAIVSSSSSLLSSFLFMSQRKTSWPNGREFSPMQ